MKKNIFYKNLQNKCNIDIETKYNNIKQDRQNLSFHNNNTIYNPITNIIPDTINKSSDLLLNNNINKDKNHDLLNKIKNERNNQDNNLKPISSKIINKIDSETIHINEFSDLRKSAQNNTIKKSNNNLINELKELGLLN
jgi:hypothetical protein